MGAKLTQCPNGHYYDAEQYTSCPYCQSVTSNSFNDTDRVTDSFIPAQGSGYGYGGNGNDDRTMPIDHISERQPMRYTSPTATPTAPLFRRISGDRYSGRRQRYNQSVILRKRKKSETGSRLACMCGGNQLRTQFLPVCR